MTNHSPFLPVDSGHRTQVAYGPVRLVPATDAVPPTGAELAELGARMDAAAAARQPSPIEVAARHCEQAQAGYFYCATTPGDPCGPGPYPHDGHTPGQCASPRAFTPARHAQGFKDQAHLDAFYAYLDHKAACGTCGQPGPGCDAPDGWQPSEQICEDGRALLNASSRWPS
jgi:hypothetical protein